jgi:hypothetical protein
MQEHEITINLIEQAQQELEDVGAGSNVSRAFEYLEQAKCQLTGEKYSSPDEFMDMLDKLTPEVEEA